VVDRLTKNIIKRAKDTQPLGDLNIPIVKMLAFIATMNEELDERDFELMMLILSQLYDVDDESIFRERLGRAVLKLASDNDLIEDLS